MHEQRTVTANSAVLCATKHSRWRRHAGFILLELPDTEFVTAMEHARALGFKKRLFGESESGVNVTVRKALRGASIAVSAADPSRESTPPCLLISGGA
jgi:hypothetical protein